MSLTLEITNQCPRYHIILTELIYSEMKDKREGIYEP